MPDVSMLKERAAGLLAGFTRGQKTMLVVAVGAFLIGALFFVRWAAAPSWAPLYGDLAPEDAAGVTSQLSAMGVPYRISDGGGSIMVPRDRVHQSRLDLSAQGLPSAGAPGYALLDEQGITTSQFRQRVDYQRALEGELARTIRSIDGIEAATVHLVIPEDDLFSGDERRPTASVLVRPGRDTQLSGGQVQSIVHLVASSVESLRPTDVTVADSEGRMLATPGEDGLLSAAGDARASQTERFERQLGTSIEELLAPVTGAGRARVRVTAQLDFDRRATTSELFTDAEDSPVLVESNASETYTGSGGAVGGVLGPDALPIGGDGTETEFSSERSERSFAVGKVTEQVQGAPGAVERLSIAVLMDEQVDAAPADIRQLVSAAAGLDLDRGDTLEVSLLRFDDSALDAARAELDAAAGGDDSPLLGLARIGGVVGIVALVLLLAWRSTKAASVARYPLAVPIEPKVLEAPERGLPAGDEEEDDDDLALGPAEQLDELSEDDGDRLVLTSQIGGLIDRQPDEVAQVLRGWLADRRG